MALLAGSWLAIHRLDSEQDKTAQRSAPNPWARLVRMSTDGEQGQEWPFSALRGKGTAMPPYLRRVTRETLGRGHQVLNLRFQRAQYAKTALGFGIWVLRGEGITCMLHASATLVACNAIATVARHGLKMVGGDDPTPPPPGALPDRFLAFGIAPDWARAVRVRIVGGASKTIPIDDNTYALRAGAPINVEKLIGWQRSRVRGQ
jgi:hypothetical protein